MTRTPKHTSGMDRRSSSLLPFVAAALLFVSLLLLVLYQSYSANQSHLVYALDDAYIHMAIAKNLTLHGVFGVTRYHFSSSTSSPLWTLLLAACFKVLGVRDQHPMGIPRTTTRARTPFSGSILAIMPSLTRKASVTTRPVAISC